MTKKISLILLFLAFLVNALYWTKVYFEEVEDIKSSVKIDKDLSKKYIEGKFTLETKTTKLTPKLKELEQEIDNFRMWIYLPQINMSEPVVQGKDNEYYLHYNPKHEKSILGSIFLDSQNKPFLKDNFTNFVFGHKSSLSGARFSSLDILDNHINETVYFYQNQEELTYKILDTFYVKPETNLYPIGLWKKEDIENFQTVLKEYSNIEVNKEDNYVFLITCKTSDDTTERKVVMLKLIETKKLPQVKEVINE